MKPGVKHYEEISKAAVDKITGRRTFEPMNKPQVGCRYHIFKQKGESLEGILGFPIVNFQRSTSYPLELESGEIVEILGNKQLHKLIKKGELCGQMVRIMYIGREYLNGWAGHWHKIYRAFKISDQTEKGT